MGKPKQQVISRFFSPKPSPNPPNPNPTNPLPKSPKVAAVVSYSPAKRRSLNLSPNPSRCKQPKPCPAAARRLLDPAPDPGDSEEAWVPAQPSGSYTPLEQQVRELKKKYPDVLLMIEVGYRYRFFGQDAEVAARVLGIIVHPDRHFMTASVPTFRLQFHVRRLVAAGHKVGVVKQTETAAIKAHGANRLAPFSRALSALYTRATIDAAETLQGGDNDSGFAEENSTNYVLCVVDKEITGPGPFQAKVGLLAIEISTGDVVQGEFNDGPLRPGLEAILLSLSPVEILLGEPVSTETEKLLTAYVGPKSNVRIDHMPCDCFNEGGALAEVMSLFENMDDVHTKGNIHRDQINESKESNSLCGIEV